MIKGQEVYRIEYNPHRNRFLFQRGTHGGTLNGWTRVEVHGRTLKYHGCCPFKETIAEAILYFTRRTSYDIGLGWDDTVKALSEALGGYVYDKNVEFLALHIGDAPSRRRWWWPW